MNPVDRTGPRGGQVINLTHLRYEVVRAFRNRGFLIVTLGMPLMLYCTVIPGNRYEPVEGMTFSFYFMTGMAAYGALLAVFSPTLRMAADRSRGRDRQARVTPLRLGTCVAAKVVAAFTVALSALVPPFAVGAAFGVRLTAVQWLQMTGLLLVGLVPFIVMGLTIGYLVRPALLPVVIGGLAMLFSLFGGAFGEYFTADAAMRVIRLLPSYWLVQAGHGATTTGCWATEGWIVVGGWTAAMLAPAVAAYRRATRRP